jgi:hypothetical protein
MSEGLESSASTMTALSILSHSEAVLESSANKASRTWFVRCVVERSNTEVSASTPWSISLSFPLSDSVLRAPGSKIIGGGGGMAKKGGDDEGEELDEEGMC